MDKKGERTVSRYDGQKPKKTSGLMYNKRLLIFLSVLLSVALWVVVTLDVKQESNNVYQDILIDVQTADLANSFGLELVEINGPSSLMDKLVDVTVTGNIYSLSQITRDDITVAALPTGSISQPGVYRLSLSVTCNNRDVRATFTGGETYITARFDYTKSSVFEIDAITTSGASVDAGTGLVIGELYSTIKNVTVTGPATEISAISYVEITADVNAVLGQTSDYRGRIIFRDANGAELDESVTKYISIVGYNDTEGAPTEQEIVVTVPINKVAELPVAVSFKKIPENFDIGTLKYTINPQTVILEGGIEDINALIEAGEYMLSESVDLSQLRPDTSVQTLNLNLSSGMVEANQVESVTVSFDLSSYATKILPLTSEECEFKVINADGLDVEIIDTKIDNVIVIGPLQTLMGIGVEDCVVSVDMSAVDSASGQKLAPASIYVKSAQDCWAIGTYQVKVLVGE